MGVAYRRKPATTVWRLLWLPPEYILPQPLRILASSWNRRSVEMGLHQIWHITPWQCGHCLSIDFPCDHPRRLDWRDVQLYGRCWHPSMPLFPNACDHWILLPLKSVPRCHHGNILRYKSGLKGEGIARKYCSSGSTRSEQGCTVWSQGRENDGCHPVENGPPIEAKSLRPRGGCLDVP